MDSEQLLDTLQRHYDEVGGRSLALRRSLSLVEDLGLDSLQRMELLVATEQTLGLEIVGDARLYQLRTVGDLIELLQGMCAACAAATPAR
jgi:acyl carrier protein